MKERKRERESRLQASWEFECVAAFVCEKPERKKRGNRERENENEKRERTREKSCWPIQRLYIAARARPLSLCKSTAQMPSNS